MHPMRAPPGLHERCIRGQDSWAFASTTVACCITRAGGHMAPVTFFRDTATPVQPYFISPWQGEPGQRPYEPVLGPLRGDFFCLPFGANPPWRGEAHRIHGETAYRRWRLST